MHENTILVTNNKRRVYKVTQNSKEKKANLIAFS